MYRSDIIHGPAVGLIWLFSSGAGCATPRLPKAPITQVKLHGVHQVDRAELLGGLSHHRPDGWPVRTYASYDPLQLTIDRQRILSFYHARGFYDARLEDVEVTPHGAGYAIAFSVREGRPFTVRSVDLQGIPDRVTGTEDLGAQLPFAVGDVFVYSTYETAKRRLAHRLASEGYAHANVDGEVEVFRHDGEVAIHLRVDAGPRVRFGKVRIDAGPLPESAIRARLAFAPGDVYDPSLLALTEARIYELGLVGVATFYLPNDPSSGVMDVGIRIKAGPRNELRVGAGIARQSPNYQIRFRAGYVRRDFLHPLVRIATEVRPALLYRRSVGRFAYGVEWSASLSREDLFAPRVLGQAQVHYSLLQYEAYATLGSAVRLIAGRPWLDDRLHFSLGAVLKLHGFPRVDAVVPRDRFAQIGLPACDTRCRESGTPGGQTLLYLEPAVTFDGRNDPVDPRRGFYARAHLELGSALNESGVSWIRFTPELRGYVPIGTPRLVLAGRARTGLELIEGAVLPSTQRYFGGGSESQRGFAIRRLSPSFGEGEDAVPVGGEALFEVSAELRWHLFKVFGLWLGLVGFIDAADVRPRLADIEWLRPHVATGAGVRLFTPIGPLRFDVGYRLNRVAPGVEPGGDDRWAFHLSLGEAF